MYIIHGIKNCDTMKKACKALEAAGVEYDFFDYKKQAPTVEMVTAWVEQLGIEVVLNKRGTTWRKQTDEVKAAADADVHKAIELLVENTSMLKRPILVNTEKGVLLAGFDIDKYSSL